MRHAVLLCAAMMVTACASAQPIVRTSMTEGNLVSVAAGTFRNTGGIVAATYVIDPTTNLCFLAAYMVAGAAIGPAGISQIDCCQLRKIPEVLSALPSLGETCAASAPAPPASPAPAGS